MEFAQFQEMVSGTYRLFVLPEHSANSEKLSETIDKADRMGRQVINKDAIFFAGITGVT